MHASSADVAAATRGRGPNHTGDADARAACFGHQAGKRTAAQAVPRLRARLAADCAALPNECTNGTDATYMAAVTAERARAHAPRVLGRDLLHYSRLATTS